MKSFLRNKIFPNSNQLNLHPPLHSKPALRSLTIRHEFVYRARLVAAFADYQLPLASGARAEGLGFGCCQPGPGKVHLLVLGLFDVGSWQEVVVCEKKIQ